MKIKEIEIGEYLFYFLMTFIICITICITSFVGKGCHEADLNKESCEEMLDFYQQKFIEKRMN
jgi:hypothetical protein